MRTLELFSGTQSFSKAVARHDPSNETVTVDISRGFNPTIVADIMTWDYQVYPPGYFDVIWCSPPCQQYSKARTTGGPRDLEGADRNVLKCFEIIDYFQPRVWILENPQTGLLPRRIEALRSALPYFDADYCAFGAPYRKRTRFWTNLDTTGLRRLCPGARHCGSMQENRHLGSCANTSTRYNVFGSFTTAEKNAIPAALVDSIVARCF
jgi:hypothetical protein